MDGKGSNLRLEVLKRQLIPNTRSSSASLTAHSVASAQQKQYVVLAAPGCEGRAERLTALDPGRFTYYPTAWDKFGDQTDFIELGGYTPTNRITGNHVLFLASFHNNDVALSQLHAMVVLLESLVESFTIVLPFYPYGTMERVIKEGQIATANSAAKLFSNLPSAGKPTRIMMYDLHTLQNRFYFGNNALASLHSCIPLMEKEIASGGGKHIDCIAFPDDGAAKRYESEFPTLPKVTCRKIRDGDKRIIGIADGDPNGKHILIVDDLVQTGGTLYECGKGLLDNGALSVSCFVTHAVFPNQSWKRFAKGGDRCVFQTMWFADSIPTNTAELPTDDVFSVLDMDGLIIADLDLQ